MRPQTILRQLEMLLILSCSWAGHSWSPVEAQRSGGIIEFRDDAAGGHFVVSGRIFMSHPPDCFAQQGKGITIQQWPIYRAQIEPWIGNPKDALKVLTPQQFYEQYRHTQDPVSTSPDYFEELWEYEPFSYEQIGFGDAVKRCHVITRKYASHLPYSRVYIYKTLLIGEIRGIDPSRRVFFLLDQRLYPLGEPFDHLGFWHGLLIGTSSAVAWIIDPTGGRVSDYFHEIFYCPIEKAEGKVNHLFFQRIGASVALLDSYYEVATKSHYFNYMLAGNDLYGARATSVTRVGTTSRE